MKKILLPTDFSENAHNAAKYAMDFFGHQETRYYLYHVHDLNTLQDIVFDDIEKKLKQELDQFNQTYHDQIITIETETGSGSIVKNILAYSKQIDADFIVMGTEGASRPKWFGSNTVEVLLHANCPVIAVPNGVEYRKPEKVLLPLDLKIGLPKSDFELVYNEIKSNTPFIHIITIIDHNESIFSDFIADELKAYLGDIRYAFTFSNHKNIAEGVAEYARKIDPDLLLLFPRKRTVLQYLLNKSVSKRIAHMSKIPLFSMASKTIG